MRPVRFFSLAAMVMACLPALAETAQETAVRKLIQPRLGADTKIDSVTRTPYLGLFEVRTGFEIIYTDARAQYMFVGNVVNAKTSQDYTKARIEEISKIRFADLPLNMALKQVKGTGARQIAVFEDPNCGYCKQLRESLQSVDNVTIYTFMFNILSDESAAISKNIWCSADPVKAWDDWMLKGTVVPEAPATCKSPNDQVMATGQKIKVNATPTIFFADGTRVPGAMDTVMIEARLASTKAPR